MTVYSFGEAQAVNVVAGHGGASRCRQGVYRGPFRFEPASILAQRDLRDPANRSLRLTVEIAWEPRLKPIDLKQRLADVTIRDEAGHTLPVADPAAALDMPAKSGVPAVEMVLPLNLPGRGQQRIARLDGTLIAQMPGPVETFRFEHVGRGAEGGGGRVEKRASNVTVTLDEVRKNGEAWEVRMRVRFDQAGDALDSYRGWIFQNEAYLEGPDGKPLPYGTMETTLQGQNEVGLAYLFELNGDAKNYAFVYKTPTAIVPLKVDYQFRDIPLP